MGAANRPSREQALRETLASPHTLDERAELAAADRHFDLEEWGEGFRALGRALRAANGGHLPSPRRRVPTT